MRALITGDRGFLGRHFRSHLANAGWEVHGLDVKATSAQDCRSYFRDSLSRGPDRGLWDLVVHCAAVVGGRETIERDPLATAESLSIDAEMFRWAAVARPKQVLYISSSAAYPVSFQRHQPGHSRTGYRLHEDDVWGPDSPMEPDEVYGWSKVTGEMLAGRLRATGVPVTVVRPFSGYGADQDPSYPFRAILDRVKARQDPLEVWCAPCTRDWIHVDDLVAGALAVARSFTEDPVNLCTGRGTSFQELIEIACREAGWAPSQLNIRGDMPQGVAYRVGNPNRMRQFYNPVISLEEGIKRALSED